MFKVPRSPSTSSPSLASFADLEAEMEAAHGSRTFTKTDLAILASLDQVKNLQKDLDSLQRGKVNIRKLQLIIYLSIYLYLYLYIR